MSTVRVNHGPCIVCGKPIVYLGARYCGPACHFSSLGAPESLASLRPVLDERPRPEPLVKKPVFYVEDPRPAVEPVEQDLPDPMLATLFGIEAPPDEPPVRRRLYL